MSIEGADVGPLMDRWNAYTRQAKVILFSNKLFGRTTTKTDLRPMNRSSDMASAWPIDPLIWRDDLRRGGRQVPKVAPSFNARTGSRTRVEASTGLHDRPLHYPDSKLGPASQIRTGDIAVAARCTKRCETYYSRALYQAELRRVQLCNATLVFSPFDSYGRDAYSFPKGEDQIYKRSFRSLLGPSWTATLRLKVCDIYVDRSHV